MVLCTATTCPHSRVPGSGRSSIVPPTKGAWRSTPPLLPHTLPSPLLTRHISRNFPRAKLLTPQLHPSTNPLPPRRLLSLPGPTCSTRPAASCGAATCAGRPWCGGLRTIMVSLRGLSKGAHVPSWCCCCRRTGGCNCLCGERTGEGGCWKQTGLGWSCAAACKGPGAAHLHAS